MKIENKFLSRALLVAGLIVGANAQAATYPSTIVPFDAANSQQDFSIRYKSWSDPAFGDLGWTHTSNWGSFDALEGQKVTIFIQAATVGIHPGSTVWFRGADDTAPNNYVPDHVYAENVTLFKYGATDEATGEAVGDIIMKHVIHGYDQDNNPVRKRGLRGIKDRRNGRLVLTFIAPHSGHYMFVVGGISPDPTVDPSVGHKVKVKVDIK